MFPSSRQKIQFSAIKSNFMRKNKRFFRSLADVDLENKPRCVFSPKRALKCSEVRVRFGSASIRNYGNVFYMSSFHHKARRAKRDFLFLPIGRPQWNGNGFHGAGGDGQIQHALAEKYISVFSVTLWWILIFISLLSLCYISSFDDYVYLVQSKWHFRELLILFFSQVGRAKCLCWSACVCGYRK